MKEGFEALALGPLTDSLRLCFRYDPPKGYRSGRERIQRMLMRMYDCDARQANGLVRRLESNGYIYAGDRQRPRRRKKRRGKADEARWYFEPNPA